MYETTKDVSAYQLDEAVHRFLQFVSEQHVLARIDRIIEHFATYARKQEGIQKIVIVSARVLHKKVIEKIKEQFGKRVEAETHVDKSLMGGIKVKVDSLVLDGSVRTQLSRLKERLLTN